jgi:hypothetical protein
MKVVNLALCWWKTIFESIEAIVRLGYTEMFIQMVLISFTLLPPILKKKFAY